MVVEPVWAFILILVGVLILGVVLGFFVARKYMVKYLEENPPITEDIVRMMMGQMGRTPSQKQVNQVMKSISNQPKKPAKPKLKKKK